ncbi:MAG: hypothetical protein ACKODH_06110 [Limisphaerales bacterium]
MTQERILQDCLVRLNQAGVAYLVTGSMASNYWGIPRTTHDLDFVIQLPPSAIPQFVAAFRGDYFVDEEAVRAAFRPPHQFNAIHEHSAFKVDFWLPVNSPFEREMFKRRLARPLFGVPAWIATAEDVLLHKLYWDKLTPSERQLGDAAGIFRIQRDALDEAYLRQWAAELNVMESLNRLFEGKLKPKST